MIQDAPVHVVPALDLGPRHDALIVGDVHGCADELRALLDRARFDPAAHRLVLVGDAFAKGPDPAGVAEIALESGARTVLGNHDAALLRRRARLCGHPAGDPAGDAHGWCCRVLDAGAPRIWRWIEQAPLALRVEDVLVVHAGVDPDLGAERTPRDRLLTVRRLEERPGAPFWWEVWRGPDTVVFGHDARRGHVRVGPPDRPVAVGLDTGCVYGGRLSAWWCRERRMVSVPARRAYCPLDRPSPPSSPTSEGASGTSS